VYSKGYIQPEQKSLKFNTRPLAEKLHSTLMLFFNSFFCHSEARSAEESPPSEQKRLLAIARSDKMRCHSEERQRRGIPSWQGRRSVINYSKTYSKRRWEVNTVQAVGRLFGTMSLRVTEN